MKEKINPLAKAIIEFNKNIPPCDSYTQCPEMKKMVVEKDITHVPRWKYCPWCGREIKRK